MLTCFFPEAKNKTIPFCEMMEHSEVQKDFGRGRLATTAL